MAEHNPEGDDPMIDRLVDAALAASLHDRVATSLGDTDVIVYGGELFIVGDYIRSLQGQ